MAGDFNKPVVIDAYASVLAYVRDIVKDLALGLDSTGTANIPSGAIRFNSLLSRWEKYNGSAWAILASQYAIDVATVGGKSVGNASGNIPLSNGSLNTNLNAQYLNGFAASQSNTANNVVVREANGYITTGYLNTVADVTGTVPSHFAVQTNSDNYVRWRTLASVKSDLAIGAGATNVAAAGTYGGINIVGAANGWSGFQFNSGSRYFMTSSGQTGEYDTGAGAWQWRWDNGALSVGTVPWARLSGVPSFNYLPSTGGQISGGLQVTGEVHIGYGQNASRLYFGDADESTGGPKCIHANSNIMGFLNGSGSWMFYSNHAGQIYSANYGWLHDYFTRTVNAGGGLTGGGSGSSLTLTHSNNGTAGSYGLLGSLQITTNAHGHVTSAGVYNCNCNCGW